MISETEHIRPTFSAPPRPSCFGYFTLISPKCKTCIDRKACVDSSNVKISKKIIGSGSIRYEKNGKVYVNMKVGKTTVQATLDLHETP
jgi:hypothetical protein